MSSPRRTRRAGPAPGRVAPDLGARADWRCRAPSTTLCVRGRDARHASRRRRTRPAARARGTPSTSAATATSAPSRARRRRSCVAVDGTNAITSTNPTGGAGAWSVGGRRGSHRPVGRHVPEDRPLRGGRRQRPRGDVREPGRWQRDVELARLDRRREPVSLSDVACFAGIGDLPGDRLRDRQPVRDRRRRLRRLGIGDGDRRRRVPVGDLVRLDALRGRRPQRQRGRTEERAAMSCRTSRRTPSRTSRARRRRCAWR